MSCDWRATARRRGALRQAASQAELPLPRVYLTVDAGTETLTRFGAVGSYVTDTAVAATFGRYRMHAMYLVPLSLLARPGALLADFARHRQGFRVGQLSGELPTDLGRDTTYIARRSRPAASVLWAFARREYPDLGATLAPH